MSFCSGSQDNPNNSPVCGRQVTARCAVVDGDRCRQGSQPVTVTVVDMCPPCAEGDLDLSPAAFRQMAGGSLDAGRVDIVWSWA